MLYYKSAFLVGCRSCFLCTRCNGGWEEGKGGRRKQWSRRWMEETEELHHTAGQSLHSLLKSLEIASSDPQQGWAKGDDLPCVQPKSRLSPMCWQQSATSCCYQNYMHYFKTLNIFKWWEKNFSSLYHWLCCMWSTKSESMRKIYSCGLLLESSLGRSISTPDSHSWVYKLLNIKRLEYHLSE